MEPNFIILIVIATVAFCLLEYYHVPRYINGVLFFPITFPLYWIIRKTSGAPSNLNLKWLGALASMFIIPAILLLFIVGNQIPRMFDETSSAIIILLTIISAGVDLGASIIVLFSVPSLNNKFISPIISALILIACSIAATMLYAQNFLLEVKARYEYLDIQIGLIYQSGRVLGFSIFVAVIYAAVKSRGSTSLVNIVICMYCLALAVCAWASFVISQGANILPWFLHQIIFWCSISLLFYTLITLFKRRKPV